MTPIESDPDYRYVLAERLGMACEAAQPTQEQLDYARKEAREYVARRDGKSEQKDLI